MCRCGPRGAKYGEGCGKASVWEEHDGLAMAGECGATVHVDVGFGFEGVGGLCEGAWGLGMRRGARPGCRVWLGCSRSGEEGLVGVVVM